MTRHQPDSEQVNPSLKPPGRATLDTANSACRCSHRPSDFSSEASTCATVATSASYSTSSTSESHIVEDLSRFSFADHRNEEERASSEASFLRRDSAESLESQLQSLGVYDDCSVEDREAIMRVLEVDEEDRRRSEAASLALAQQIQLEEEQQQQQQQTTPAAVAQAAQTADDEIFFARLAEIMKLPKQDRKYQLLLLLEEINGDVKTERWALVAQDEIEKLGVHRYDPTSKITGKSGDDDDDIKCLVCQCEYELNENLRTLPCGHFYHKDCIDPWLKQHDCCPLCRQAIDAGKKNYY